MKKFCFVPLILIFLTISFSSFSQQRSVSPELMNVKDVFDVASFVKTTWELYAKYKDAEYAPIKAENVIVDIDKYLSKTPTVDRRNGEIKEFNLIKKYRNNLDSAFQALGIFGSNQLGEFFYDKDINIPVHFGLCGDTALTLIITGVSIGQMFNTLKSTSRQRATMVVTRYILSALKDYAKYFQGQEIKYFGMACVFGSADFSDLSSSSKKPEFLGIIVPNNLLKKYISNDLTEDELINAAEIYISDRDMITGIKKIKITLE